MVRLVPMRLFASSSYHKLMRNNRQSNDSLINFQPQAVPHIPRAWERAPHKPFAPQHRGREVWKRYDLRSKKPEHSTEISDGRDDASGQEEVFADTDRPIKRQCIINAPENAGAYQDQRPPRYIATLRARASGTPRRKLAKRKSLKSDRRKSVAGQISEGTDIPDEIARALKESEEDEDENSASERDIGHSDSMDSCANGEEGSDEATQAETLPPEEAEGLEEPQAPIVMETDEPGPAGNLQDNTKTLPAENEHEDTSATTPKNPAELNRTDGIHLERDPVVDDGAEDIIMEPSSKHDFTSHRSQSTLHKHKSPAADIQNDTVLETENILEHTSENIDQSPRNHTLSAMSEPVLHDQASDSNLRISNDESETIEPQLSSSTRSGSPACDAESVDSSPVVEPLTSLTSEGAFPRHQPATSPKPGQIIEVAQEEAESSRPEPDTDPSTAAANEANGPPPLPQSRTRSGTRFSDDTTLLQDFLNRARAHKAAKATRATPELSNPLDSAKPFSPPRRSPRRSPRKALFELDRNSPSPTKPRDVALRPKTPSKKTANPVESNDADDNDNGATTEPTSRRRSARTRLPTPVATNSQSAGPSLIPVVRRGVDEVVLAKSEAQELAGVTRANTRRNKGAAKLPALRMRMLGMEVEEEGKEREIGVFPGGCGGGGGGREGEGE
ncbi:hypothetical protein LPUS_05347 [Lasallia pustulata]|uniref:Uncharacterized protein n=1 Tax=Lasallia pustulata TaxID=136370 RepID=A0A1W5CYI3_9LECA|nr:hypothetical protein LPUS_05347 [Lasallia pustulata]